MTAGIYRLINAITGKCYIGQSKNIERRWGEHSKKYNNGAILKSISDFGWDSFEKKILIVVNNKKDLDKYEGDCIRIFNTLSPNGYNIVKKRDDKKICNTLTQEYLKSILDYNTQTGIFIWIKNSGKLRNKGNIAGSKHKRKTKIYIGISIKDKIYLAHRLAWLYMTGEWPPNLIDHKDRDGSNNKWDNLRLATYSQNNFNMVRKSKKGLLPGVQKNGNKYSAKIKFNNKQIYLGLYETESMAYEVYIKAKKDLHKEFAYLS